MSGNTGIPLKHVGDARSSQLVARRQSGDVAAAQGYGAGEDAGEPIDGVEHGGLAGAVRPDEAERLAAGEPQRKVMQDARAAVAGMKTIDGDEWRAARQALQL